MQFEFEFELSATLFGAKNKRPKGSPKDRTENWTAQRHENRIERGGQD